MHEEISELLKNRTAMISEKTEFGTLVHHEIEMLEELLAGHDAKCDLQVSEIDNKIKLRLRHFYGRGAVRILLTFKDGVTARELWKFIPRYEESSIVTWCYTVGAFMVNGRFYLRR